MATDRSSGSVGSQRPVPSWLNSPAWSHTPSTHSTKKPNTYGTTVDNGVKEREKPNVPPQNTERETVQVRPPVQEEPPVRQQGDSGDSTLGGRSGSLNSSVQSLPSSDTATSSPGSATTSRLSQSSSLSNSDRTLTGSATLDARIELFTIELSRKRIHLAELQRMSAQGIPDHGGLRSITWKLLLGYIPRNREEWAAELSKKRAEYETFKEELLVNPSKVARRKEACENNLPSIDDGDDDNDDDGVLRRQDITHDDHPLSLGSSSVWHQYFQDTELSEQIDRDVKRTHPDIQFFCGESTYALENQESLKRALFIFAKLNPGIRYVQGMNEVLAPLYYVFRTDPDEEYSVHAEADAFFCFVELLSDFRDNFCQQLDNSAVGVRATLNQLNALLRRSDEELWRHLELTAKVNPQFYAFRWITLLLTQEFNFPDCLRLWDSFLSNPDGPLEILLRVCCAMLLCVRSRLLAGDFTTNLKLLQNYPSVNINHLLGVADDLRG